MPLCAPTDSHFSQKRRDVGYPKQSERQKGQSGAPETVLHTLPVRRATDPPYLTAGMLQSDCGTMNI